MTTFYVYILECSDGKLYVGETSNMARRLYEHEQGLIEKAFTYSRRPVTLLWSREFPTRMQAKEFEAWIKPWSRKKKFALIDGGLDRVAQVTKDPAPTSHPSASLGNRT